MTRPALKRENDTALQAEAGLSEGRIREDVMFPTIYEDGRIRVFHNHSGEIFVEPSHDKLATIRISPDGNTALVITARSALITPWAHCGLPAFRVRSPRT